MYDIVDYGLMAADCKRREAYAEALRRAVTPGSVVVDIGTGTGVFALLACSFGARRVFAIEPDNSIFVAQELAAANGYAERIEFIQDFSTNVTLPERADVIISDMRGILPLVQQHIPTIIDARERLLARAGVLIPQRDTLWVSVVETADLYRDFTAPWEDTAYGFDLRAARKAAVNSSRKARPGCQMLTEPECWATLGYADIKDANAGAEVHLRVIRAGTGHGLAVWFDTILTEGICLTNSPAEPQLPYGQVFFPWTEAVNLEVGDTITVLLQAKLMGDYYVWRWDTRVFEQGNPARVKGDFKQSTFYGDPLLPARLRKQEAGYLPTLTDAGRLDLMILELMNQPCSLGDIAERIQKQFPLRFSQWRDALDHVCELSMRYGQ